MLIGTLKSSRVLELMDSGTDPRREEMKTVNLCVKVGPFSILKLT